MDKLTSRSLFVSLLASALALLLIRTAVGVPGDLDPTFSGNGKVTTDFTPGLDSAEGVAIQPSDGKIVAVGGASGAGGRFAVARYNTDGTLDTSFGSDGMVTTNFTPGFDEAFSVAIQPSDGKIVAVGQADEGDFLHMFALARYETDGTLDTTFGSDGMVTTNFASGRNDFARSVAIDPADGKIVAAGAFEGDGLTMFALARYETDGTLDNSFGSDGMVTTNFTPEDDSVQGVAIQPSDGRIVAAGTSAFRFALARYNTDGGLDTTFGSNGKVTTNVTSGPDFGSDLAIQPTDEIVVVGLTEGAGGRFALARYNADGTLDSTFSSDGLATTNITPGRDFATGVAIQPSDGKIVAGGRAGGAGGRFALARYNADGKLDTTFSSDGRVTANITPLDDFAADLAIQPSDGKIVGAGAAGFFRKFALARFLIA